MGTVYTIIYTLYSAFMVTVVVGKAFNLNPGCGCASVPVGNCATINGYEVKVYSFLCDGEGAYLPGVIYDLVLWLIGIVHVLFLAHFQLTYTLASSARKNSKKNQKLVILIKD